MDLSKQKQFNSEGAEPIVFDKKEPLSESFGLAAKKPELEIKHEPDKPETPDHNSNEAILAVASGQIIDPRIKGDDYSPQAEKKEKEKERAQLVTNYLIRGFELTANQIAENLLHQANRLTNMMKLGDDYFGRVPTAKDMLYVAERDGQITFASMDEKGARIATAEDKAALEEQSKMCIIGLSSDEVVEEVVVDLGGGKSYTKPAYIKTHANEEEQITKSIAELEETAKQLKSGEITPDELSPYAQYLAAPEAFENAPAPTRQPLVLSGNNLLPPAPMPPMS